jgi:uncharacterized protein YndB with AHSA1/START domain
MIEIKSTLSINANKSLVFKFLTDQDLLMQWFAPQVIAMPAKSTTAAFAFESDVNFKMKITKFEEGALVEWTCIDGNVDWLGSIVNFSIEQDKQDNSILIFAHTNLSDNKKIYLWEKSWNKYLLQLKTKCEEGL